MTCFPLLVDHQNEPLSLETGPPSSRAGGRGARAQKLQIAGGANVALEAQLAWKK